IEPQITASEDIDAFESDLTDIDANNFDNLTEQTVEHDLSMLDESASDVQTADEALLDALDGDDALLDALDEPLEIAEQTESVESDEATDTLEPEQLLEDMAFPDGESLNDDELENDLNDTLDIGIDDSILSEENVDFGDDPLAIDVDLGAEDERLSEQFESDEQLRADTPSQTLDEYPELELDEALEELDAPVFDNEQPLPEIEQAQAINDEVITTEDLSATESENDDLLDDDLLGSDLDNSNDMLIDELESTDFDSLLNELAEPEPISSESQKDFELDFDSLLDEKSEAEPFEVEEIDTAESDYLDIDDLLDESDDLDADNEPYQNVDMDVGLGDFEDLLAGEDSLDVDTENQGFSAKLDLARAYLEINDSESALKVIDEVIKDGPPEVQDEALALKQQLS
ncbi:MAG: FimV/HubP family polar landmark protein, partial [Pseudoalteromonas spongiae]